MTYNWQQDDWPHFRYDLSGLQDIFLEFSEKTGRVSGKLSALQESAQTEVMLDLIVAEAIKTSAIEGEYINREDVKSSIRNQLGLTKTHEVVTDMRAEGIAELLIDVRKTFLRPLTRQKLFKWHKMLFKAQATSQRILIGKWREHDDAMQVVSGHYGKWTVHFEAPPSKMVAQEMKRFITWFNNTAPGKPGEIKPPLVRSAIAHLYFESIHPFEDGNGRIGRAISEKVLSQGLERPLMMSLSRAIEANKKAYYQALKNAQASNEITSWLVYFTRTALEAQVQTETQIDFILKKAKFFDKYRAQLNQRQTKLVRRVLEEGPEGFEGGITAKKYSAMTKVSKATATRDLQHLYEINALKRIGSGRSIRYQINLL